MSTIDIDKNDKYGFYMVNLKKKDAVWPLFVFWAIIGIIGYKLSFDELDYAIATVVGALICGAIWKNF